MNDGIFVRKGKLVSLRLMREEDFPLIVEWRNKERVRNNFIYREDFTLESQRKWAETQVRSGKVVQFIICENEKDSRPIGSVYFRDIDFCLKEAEYGIFIGEDDAIGKGYGNESAILALDYAKEELELESLILRAFKRNTAAIRSYENAGFVKTQDVYNVECSDGQKDDMILMKKVF